MEKSIADPMDSTVSAPAHTGYKFVEPMGSTDSAHTAYEHAKNILKIMETDLARLEYNFANIRKITSDESVDASIIVELSQMISDRKKEIAELRNVIHQYSKIVVLNDRQKKKMSGSYSVIDGDTQKKFTIDVKDMRPPAASVISGAAEPVPGYWTQLIVDHVYKLFDPNATREHNKTKNVMFVEKDANGSVPNFAFMPAGIIDKISSISSGKESWGSGNIYLMKYLNHVFMRACQLSKTSKTIMAYVQSNNQHSHIVFNTGLTSGLDESIYLIMHYHIQFQFWIVYDILTDYNITCENRFKVYHGTYPMSPMSLPIKVTFHSDIGDLIYDPRYSIAKNANYNHILGDLDDEAESTINARRARLGNKYYNLHKSELMERFKYALCVAEKALQRDPWLAVPYYYSDKRSEHNGGIQLLVPISLDPTDRSEISAVLSIRKTAVWNGYAYDTFYMPNTLVTADKLYVHTRLIAMSHSSWLTKYKSHLRSEHFHRSQQTQETQETQETQ